MSTERLPSFRCGCGAQIIAVIFDKTGLRGSIELAGRGNVAIIQNLPGMGPRDGLPRAVRVRQSSSYREHLCRGQNAPSFSAANLNRKRKPT